MTGVKALRESNAALDAEDEAVRVFHCVFFAPERQVLIRNLSAKHDIPIDAFNEFFDLRRRISGCVEAAYQASHARACYIVNGNSILFEPLERADVGESKCGSALKHKPDLRLFRRGRVGLWNSRGTVD